MAVSTGIITIFLIGFCVAAVHKHILTTTEVPEVGACECAGFKTQKHAEKDLLAVQTLSNTTCNNLGKKNCIAECKAAIKEIKKDPEGLCKYFETVQHVKPVLFARVCNKQWFYTGLTSRNHLCCENGTSILCN